jgi:DNA-binding response OmpR family regulator
VDDDRNTIQEGDKTILIIEDDTNFAKALLKYAHLQNYKAVIEVRGDRGLVCSTGISSAGNLLDVQLPVKDGWQVMDVKINPETKHIPVHMMSALHVKKKAYERGG